MHRLGGLVGTLLVLLSACASAAPAAPPPSSVAPGSAQSKPGSSAQTSGSPATSAGAATKLIGVFTSLAGNQTPFWLAMDGGSFRQHGLEVSASLLQGSPAMASLFSGEIQFAEGAAGEILSAAAENSDLAYLSTIDPYFDFVLVAPNSIITAADLKGKKLGIAPPGGTVWVATRMVLKRVGVDPDKDVTQISMGVTQQRAVALQSGAIDASLLDIITGRKVVQAGGFHILYDLATQKVPYSTGTAVRKSWLANNHDVMQRFTDALIEGISRYKQDGTAAMASYKKYTKTDSDAEAQQMYDYYNPILLSQPFPKTQDFSETAQVMADVNPKVSSVDLNALVDPSFVQNAVDRGLAK
ncbi:MAG TPA: ABC transporter substrate-binding protein [Chloroflexota bacterium]|nr:ABC transporter substrate-binding protein [Chloroflexota bacterium]